jgi:excisionase family DNA binding protein
MNAEENDLLTKRQLIDAFRVSLSTVDRWIRRNAIPYVKLGAQVRFLRSDVEAFVHERRIGRPQKSASKSGEMI